MTLSLPDSLSAMKNDSGLLQGVFELVQKLDGKHMVANDWEQAREYSKALTMAAVVRGDYIELMHDLWCELFDGATELGSITDDPSDFPPSTIWNDGEIGKTVVLSTPFESVEAFYLYLHYFLEEKSIRLGVGAYTVDGDQLAIPDVLTKIEGWDLNGEYDAEYEFLCTAPIHAGDFTEAVKKATELSKEVIRAFATGE